MEENEILDEQITLDDAQKKIFVSSNTASGGIRFANYLIDTIVFYILSFVLGIILALFGGTEALDSLESPLASIGSIFLMIIYYIVFENAFGKTIGKMITKTKVVTESGEKPSFSQILGRTFSRLVPFEAFSFLGNDAVGWHDKWSKTRVIKTS